MPAAPNPGEPRPKPDPEPNTFDLLERWRAGDSDALGQLLDRDMDWIRSYVRRQLGDHLRKVGDTDDFVQEAAMAVLKYGPRFIIDSRRHFRGLLGKITLNVLRARHRELFALKRSPEHERGIGSDTVLYLDPPQASVTQPDAKAAQHEEREWVRLGLLVLDPADQELLDLHWQGLSDSDIGERLQLKANTARMRRSRAYGRLTKVVLKLKRGEIEAVIGEDQAE